MHHYRQALLRMRQGDSDRQIAAAKLMGRRATSELRLLALERDWLNAIAQTRSHKTKDKQPKLYCWHAQEVECISKGKSRNPYEFGVKVGMATTLKGTLIVGARAYPGNPYDSHTLNEKVVQASILMQATGMRPETAYVDLGYRGVDKGQPGYRHQAPRQIQKPDGRRKKVTQKTTSDRTDHRPFES